MFRLFVSALLFCAFTQDAFAQASPCPYVTMGWTKTYGPPLTAVQYDESTQLFYATFNYTTISAFSNVPRGIITSFSSSANPLQLFNSVVVSRYHALVLSEKNNCPLLYETGAYLWAD